jgi:hypothetical protein
MDMTIIPVVIILFEFLHTSNIPGLETTSIMGFSLCAISFGTILRITLTFVDSKSSRVSPSPWAEPAVIIQSFESFVTS